MLCVICCRLEVTSTRAYSGNMFTPTEHVYWQQFHYIKQLLHMKYVWGRPTAIWKSTLGNDVIYRCYNYYIQIGKQTPNLAKTRKIWIKNGPIALNFDSCIYCRAAETLAKFETDVMMSTNTRDCGLEILRGLTIRLLSAYSTAAPKSNHTQKNKNTTFVCS